MKIKLNKLFTTTALACSCFTFGQEMLPQQQDTSLFKQEIIFSGRANYAGTSLLNEMSSALLEGGELSQDIKNRSFAQHRVKNIFGADISGEISYLNYNPTNIGKGKYGIKIIAGAYSYLSASYRKDAFGLAFYGTNLYKGKTADFSDTDLNSYRMQKLGIGLVDKVSKSSVNLNYYSISNYSQLSIARGTLAINEDASESVLDLGGSYLVMDDKGFNKGFGVGLDADFRLKVEWIKESTAFFQLQAKNIGFMSLKNLSAYAVDSSFSFSGFSLFNSASLDSSYVDSLGLYSENVDKRMVLPGFIQFGKMIDEHSTLTIQSYFGIRLYTRLNYNPLVFAGWQYRASKKIKIGAQASYGGFAHFRCGIYTQYDFGKFHLGLGTEDLIGGLSKKGKGESIFLRISARW
jgi:hypothetical protein